MTVNYYQFIPCCQGQETLYFSGSPDDVAQGTYTYEGRCYTVVYIFATYPEDLDPVPTIPEIGPVADCNDLKCECCQCVRIRTRNPLPAPVSIPAVDCGGQFVGITIPADGSWSEKTCLSTWTVDEKVMDIEILGDCEDRVCPTETCFLLEDCEGKAESIYASYQSLSAYLDHTGTIKIDGHPDTCWTFREIDTCECAIEVTVLSTWVDCNECINCKGFRLTNCEDGTVRYTTNNLADQVGKAVELENCSGCWFVECLEEYPPNDQNLVVEYEFDSCEDCAKNFFKLTACGDTPSDASPIFTDTDLSAYVGFILHLDGLPGICWEVEETRDLEGNSFETVFIDQYFEDCTACVLGLYDCQCSSAVNSWPVTMQLTYLNCNGEWIQTDPVPPGQRSGRYCVVLWSEIGKIATDHEYYGDCVSEEQPVDADGNIITTWECAPEQVVTLRSIRPGYDTPGCPPDYFEKVSCNFAESLYKDVLEDRYGITTNCSEDDFRKWEIKKELLNMAAILDPDYDCPPVASGCYDPCAPTGLELCTSRCHQYTVTIPADAPDQDIVYTACDATETTTINHTLIDTPTVYTICIQGGTPITTTDGVILFIDECEA